ncbi:MAG: YegP family protein [Xanthomonadaceae bacterium]|jgi:uncharacterized protein YegP (UPF0339 family)|nr:YegP family protein [Xanthomonadaceae bacterium]
MVSKFVISRCKNREFRFALKAGNGETILISEGYDTKDGALNGIQSVRSHSQVDGQYEWRETKNGDPYFVLKANNGQIIGTSEIYGSEAAREKGAASLVRNAPGAPIHDQTI